MTPAGVLLASCPYLSNTTSDMRGEQVDLIFLANNVSGKCEEIKHDSHVNVSFYDHSTTSWVSYAGVAQIVPDKEIIQKHWSSL